jgi:hypothetical protein
MTKRPFPFLKFFFVPNNLLDLIVESFSVLMFGEVASCIGGVRFSWGGPSFRPMQLPVYTLGTAAFFFTV